MSALRPMEFLRVAPASAVANVQVSVAPTSGSPSVSIPIPLTPGRDGFGPSLALTHGGHDPLSPFAHGWSLAGLPSIDVDVRDGLPQYDGAERFRYAGQELVPIDEQSSDHDTRYTGGAVGAYQVRVFRTRLESKPIRVEQWTDEGGRSHWRVRMGDGSLQVFGRRDDGESRIADPNDATRTFRWLFESAFDRLGNAMVVRYAAEDDTGVEALSLDASRFAEATANRHPKRILYGNAAPYAEDDDTTSAVWHFEAVFDYGDHDDDEPDVDTSQDWSLRQDASFTGRMGFEVRTRRLCRRVLMFHHFATELGEDATLVGTLELAHDEAPEATMLTGVRYVGCRTESSARVLQATPWAAFVYTEAGTEEAFEVYEVPLLGPGTQLIDLLGEGLPGLFTATGEGARFARNLGDGAFGAHELMPEWPRGIAQATLADFDRDGNVELVALAGTEAGYYRLDRRTRRWERLQRFDTALNVAGQVFQADLSGDGRPDVVMLHEAGLTFLPNRGPNGFGEPVEVRLDAERMPFGNPSLHRFVADMTGDGLADVVEVHNGAVRYWPNLGRGRFGEPVVMDSAPHFDAEGSYDPERLLLVDIDGTGASDLIYLRHDGVVLCAHNQRGVVFAELAPIAWGLSIPGGARLSVTDVLGDGSSCLAVLAPSGAGAAAFHTLRLSSATGARQVESVTHPLGATTAIEWGHSVRHYLRDAAAGRDWDAPLPTQRPVVNALHRLEPIDDIGQSERFIYHDGYYDPRERAFGVFAIVEHFDADVEATLAGVTPLLTRRFSHTGEMDHHARFVARYYSGDENANGPPLSGLEVPPSRERDFEESLGALVGTPVREETYATNLTGTPVEHPFRVVATSSSVSMTRSSNDRYRTGVQVVARDTRTSDFEQASDDARTSVRRVLTVDAYLTPTLTFQAGLARRPDDENFEPQNRILATASTASFVHFDEETRFELAVPKDVFTYEVHVPESEDVFDEELADTLATTLDSATSYDVPLDPAPDPDVFAAREITHTRVYYWNEDQDAPLALGSVGPVTLVHHSEDAAYDRGQLDTIFDDRVDPDADLPDLGYVEDDDVFFKVGATSSFGDASTFHRLEQTEAYDGGVHQVGADTHYLAAASMTDPVGNEVMAEIDYHVLAPFRLTDPNGTVREIDYDPLGVARRTSRYGHALAADETTVVDHGFDELTFGAARPTIDDALDDPEVALAAAESLLVYEFASGGAPMRVLTLTAEQFSDRGPDAGDADARARVGLSYSDGFGRELQSRVLVEPGVAWTLDGPDLVEDDVETRWRVTGYVVFDAKGQPVQQYEPFFRDDHVFESALDRRKFGVTTTTTLDAVGRTVRQDLANDTFSETSFTSWSRQTLDPNDTSDRATAYVAARSGLDHDDPEYIAWQQAVLNQETPVAVHLDPLGRQIATTELVHDPDTSEVTLVETASIEIRGLSEQTTDRRDLVASTRSFDRLGRLLFETSMDAGERRTLYDAEGREVKHWREDTAEEREFDAAGRMTKRHVTQDSTTWLAELIAYGETVMGAADRNQLGRVILVEDAAGTLSTPRYGAFGEPLEVERKLITAAGTDPDWTDPDLVSLETSGYATKTAADALGRPTHALLPDGTERLFGYLRSGPLETLDVITPDSTTRHILVSAEYNARGQLVSQELGNNVAVSNEYEVDTFRLYRSRADFDGTDTYQDLRHHYDPVGNLVYVDDVAQSPTADLVVADLPVTAERVFQYDDRYQLIQASGRVHHDLVRADYRGDTPTSYSFRGTKRVDLSDGSAVRRYTRTYTYDHGGNLGGYTHDGEGTDPGNTWTNDKWVSSTSNRQYFAYDLNDVAISDPASFFDARGQITALPNLRSMEWSPRDQLRRVVLIERDTDPDDDELYDYAADGKRLRKTTNRLVSGNVERTETIYLDGCEFRRVTQITPTPTSTVILERWSSHAEGDTGRLATLYRWDLDTLEREREDDAFEMHFHLASNIGSVSVELDADGGVLSYEEYFPYGGTAFVAGDSVTASFRTLRFVGKDQDDATGFYIFQFRCYAPFLGNWVSTDPAGEVDGPNLYQYCHGNPVNITDALGLDTELDQFSPYSEAAANYSIEGDESYTPSTGLPQYAVAVPTAPATSSPASATTHSTHRHSAARHQDDAPDIGSGSGESLESEAQLRADLDRSEQGDPFDGVVPGGASSVGASTPLEAEARLRADLDRVQHGAPFEGLIPEDAAIKSGPGQSPTRRHAPAPASTDDSLAPLPAASVADAPRAPEPQSNVEERPVVPNPYTLYGVGPHDEGPQLREETPEDRGYARRRERDRRRTDAHAAVILSPGIGLGPLLYTATELLPVGEDAQDAVLSFAGTVDVVSGAAGAARTGDANPTVGPHPLEIHGTPLERAGFAETSPTPPSEESLSSATPTPPPEAPPSTQDPRELRLDELARDPDHHGASTPASRAEGEAALGLEEAGQLAGPVHRPSARESAEGHRGDFVDGRGGDWDVKSPRSRAVIQERIRQDARAAGRAEPRLDPGRPMRGEFTVEDEIAQYRGEVAAGEDVIIDTRNLTPEDIELLRTAIDATDLAGHVRWFPPR